MKNLLTRFALLSALSICVMSGVRADTKFDPAETTDSGKYFIEANWSELHHAWSVLTLKISDSELRPVTDAKVRVLYDMAAMPMNPPDKPIVNKGDGTYEKRVFLGMLGVWNFEINVDAAPTEDVLKHSQKIVQ